MLEAQELAILPWSRADDLVVDGGAAVLPCPNVISAGASASPAGSFAGSACAVCTGAGGAGVAAAAAGAVGDTAAAGMIFTVTNTKDSGAGSLRQAILDANANAVAIQHMQLQNEGWERDYDVPEPQEPTFTEPPS